MTPAPPFVRRVRIRNYKSIGFCDVELGPLTVLVGRNGAGKSNFLDALRFISDSLHTSLEHAIQARGGIDDVRRRSGGHPRNFEIRLELCFGSGLQASYGFEIAARPRGAFAVKQEDLLLWNLSDPFQAKFRREEGSVVASISDPPPVLEDRLYLVNAAGRPEFRPPYDGLTSMGFYNLNPDAMRELQSPDAGARLHRDGSNIASILARLESDREGEAAINRANEFLNAIVPGIKNVKREALGPKETIQFSQETHESKKPLRFYAASMSDGTLRALGALVAAAQVSTKARPMRLVGIEEPESALHPVAAGILVDALREATRHTQILVTTHNPDLLDNVDVESDALLAVQNEAGTTSIGRVDRASLEAIRTHLYLPGELLRMDQLAIDPAHLEQQRTLPWPATSTGTP